MPTDTEQNTEATATDETTDEQRDEAMPEGLNDGGKAALKAERDAKRAAVKEARELKERLAAFEAAKTEADAAKAKADEDEAVKRGEFEQLATKRAEELTTVTGERDSLKSRLDTALKLLATNADAQWKDVPAEVAELYDGAADDPLAKLAFIDRNQKIIAAIKGKQDAKIAAFDAASRTRTPNPDTSGKPVADDEARKAQARAVSRF